MTEYILSIDQGTTNTKAIVVDSEGKVIARASQPVSVFYPQSSWVEQDPLEIWRSTRHVIGQCLQQVPGHNIKAIAITNQRESAMIWDKSTGMPIGPCVTWQCRRSASLCKKLADQDVGAEIHTRTGLQLDPGFSAGKISWLLDHETNAREKSTKGELCAGTIDSWLLWNLTEGQVHACDVTNASRTQLYNIHTLEWDTELCEFFQVPQQIMPAVHPSSNLFGYTMTDDVLPDGVPVACMIGDSHAALYGHAGFLPGTIKATYGTGSSLMTRMDSPVISSKGISTTIAWGSKDYTAYALEGNISVTGAAVQWYGQLLGLEHAGIAVEKLAAEVDGNGGVYFVPAFVGLGAPHWDPSARGLITGLTRGSTAAHLARATLESIAYQVRDVFDAMDSETENTLKVLLADGGASENNLLMQFQADILGHPVLRRSDSDVSAIGAAYLAGLCIGIWSSEQDIAKLPRPSDRFEPRMTSEKRARLYRDWQHAVTLAMQQPDVS
jgi:glycerol kinase